jgi:uncharacterized membrane protein YphA (DoxX/SURF4 family)
MEKNLELKELDYQRIFPWLIRLSLGVALIGAGTSEAFVSPVLSGYPGLSFLQTLVGFLLLIGFVLEVSIIAAIVLFAVALLMNPYMIGNLDFLALAIAFLLIGESRPGIDDLLEVPCYCLFTKMNEFLPFILRIGIGVSMIFLAVYEKLLNPMASAVIVEQYNLHVIIPVSVEMWVFSVGVIELFIGLFLLFGFFTRVSSAVAFVVLSLSFFFFGEEVYSHITLFATLAILFVTGGNKWSLDDYFGHKRIGTKLYLKT